MKKNHLLLMVVVCVLGCVACKKTDGNKLSVSTYAILKLSETLELVFSFLFEKYLWVEEVKVELEKAEKRLTQDYQNQVNAFKAEYENYLKVGASMTLSEQKKKEEALGRKQQNLAQMEAKYAEQLMQLKAGKNEEIQNKIFTFIEKYNQEKGKYSLIMSKARTSGVLYSEPQDDITAEIIEAINAEYTKEKGKK